MKQTTLHNNSSAFSEAEIRQVASEITPETAGQLMRFGGHIVDSHESHTARIFEYGDGMSDEGFTMLRELGNMTLGRQIQGEQQRFIEHVDEARLDNFARNIETLQPPALFQNAFQIKSSTANIGRELATKVLTTTDQLESVTNFFEWYNSALDAYDNKFQQEIAPDLLGDFSDHLEAAANAGIVPSYLIDRLAKLRDGKLHVGIVDRSLLEEKDGGALHFTNGEERIEIHLNTPKEYWEHVFTHEGLHTLEGRSKPPVAEKPTLALGKDWGLYRLFGPGIVGDVLNEAVIEHATDSILHGHPEVIMPVESQRKHSEYYFPDRALLHILANCGVQPIHPSLFFDAMFEDGTVDTSPANQRLKAALTEAYPDTDVFTVLGGLEAKDSESIVNFARQFFLEHGAHKSNEQRQV